MSVMSVHFYHASRDDESIFSYLSSGDNVGIATWSFDAASNNHDYAEYRQAFSSHAHVEINTSAEIDKIVVGICLREHVM